MCEALAFLKSKHVNDGLIEIHSEAPYNEKLYGFLDYFDERWLENEEIPLLPYVLSRRHRTTNAVEGWHHTINSILVNPKSNVKDICLLYTSRCV